MANILTLKRRIQAAQNVSKTTKAMQMIAASKMKRAQEAALASRPYTQKLMSVATNISANIKSEAKHPFIMPKNLNGKTLVIVISPDKGLCGGMVTNLLREFFRFEKTNEAAVFVTVGKKIESQAARKERVILASFPFGNTTPSFDVVFPITRIINEQYLNGKVSSVKVMTTHFTSVFTQTPKLTNLLPIELPEKKENLTPPPYLFEPDVESLIDPLLNHYLEMTLFQFFLESFVSEQAARMLAMQNATDNANSIIEDLKLEYNKTRQAKITSEILDISSAAMQ